MDIVEVLLAEYETLREESLQSLRQQQLVLQVGLAALGVVVGLGSRVRPFTLAGVVLGIFGPLIAVLVAYIWGGELERMARAGAHLVRVESRMSEMYAGAQPLQWETLLARGDPLTPRIYGSHQAVARAFSGAGAASGGIGSYLLIAHGNPAAGIAMAIGNALVAIHHEVWFRRLKARLLSLPQRTLTAPTLTPAPDARPSVGTQDSAPAS